MTYLNTQVWSSINSYYSRKQKQKVIKNSQTRSDLGYVYKD